MFYARAPKTLSQPMAKLETFWEYGNIYIYIDGYKIHLNIGIYIYICVCFFRLHWLREVSGVSEVESAKFRFETRRRR